MASPLPILLLGAGGHARSCIDAIEQHGGYVIAGLVGTATERNTRILGYPVVADETDMEARLADIGLGLVAVGQLTSPALRMRLFAAVERQGGAPPAIISPHAYVSPRAIVEAGSIVLHGAVVNAGARVGRNCIVNSMALIEHDVSIADHCHIATGARLNGGVSVGVGSFVGSGATIKQGVSIGRNCVLGMGLAIRHDCADGTTLRPGER